MYIRCKERRDIYIAIGLLYELGSNGQQITARVILFAFHPEFMLHGYNEKIANTMDMTLNIASLLTDVQHADWDYFSRRFERARAAGRASL